MAMEQSLRRRKEQRKGLDSFDRDKIKGGCIAGFPSGALMFYCFDQSEKSVSFNGQKTLS